MFQHTKTTSQPVTMTSDSLSITELDWRMIMMARVWSELPRLSHWKLGKLQLETADGTQQWDLLRTDQDIRYTSPLSRLWNINTEHRSDQLQTSLERLESFFKHKASDLEKYEEISRFFIYFKWEINQTEWSFVVCGQWSKQMMIHVLYILSFWKVRPLWKVFTNAFALRNTLWIWIYRSEYLINY